MSVKSAVSPIESVDNSGPQDRVAIIEMEKCLGCGACSSSCEQEAILLNEYAIATIDQKKCTGCGSCIDKCPNDVICLVAKPKKNLAARGIDAVISLLKMKLEPHRYG